jgi:hypothetical protein
MYSNVEYNLQLPLELNSTLVAEWITSCDKVTLSHNMFHYGKTCYACCLMLHNNNLSEPLVQQVFYNI